MSYFTIPASQNRKAASGASLLSLPAAVCLRKAGRRDLDAVCAFYQTVIADLDKRKNYPLWTWGVHPHADMIAWAIAEGELYVFTCENRLIGSALVNDELEGEELVSWTGKNPKSIHLFAIHPALGGHHLGDRFLSALINETTAAADSTPDSLRLNLIEGNLPARNLYLRCGFVSLGQYDVDLPDEGVLHFEMMERLL